nr:MAG TPA: Putative tail protein [Caudoviricetes sp.]
MTEASASNYWISSTALSITLNAMGDADYIQANVASGAMIMCYMRNIDGLGYDAGHNYRRWNLIANPTYFNSTTEKYVYAAIPRKQQENGTALIVFPSERVDIYGKSATEVQLGSEDYYYIFLGGVISPSVVGGVLQNRTWTQRVDTGKLASDEAIAAGGDNTWWLYNAVDDTVTFLKAIVRAAFDNIEAKYATVKNLIIGGETLTGVANNETPKNSRVDVVTPDYLFGNSDARYVRKDIDDRVSSILTFINGVHFGDDFEKDLRGAGIYRDEQGSWHIDTDYIHARKKLTAEEVEIMKTSHIKGKVVNSAGGFVISRIEKINGAWRCFFVQQDSEGRRVYNSMLKDDLALCETFNLIDNNGQTANHYWYRRVTAVGTDYVDIADNTNVDYYASGSDVPQVGDEVVQLGNLTVKERQSAIIQSAAGEGSPYFKIIKGINSFILPDPIFLFDKQNFEIRVENPANRGEYIPLQNFLETMQGRLNAVQQQSDKQLVIWFGDVVPTLTSEPANEWTDDETKEMHEHDVYYNRSYAETGGGRAYSFEKNPDGSFSWHEITDADVLKSLEAAKRAQDTADGKRRAFVQAVPVPPYDKGDQWSNATFEDKYNNDLLVCVRPKATGESFDIEDWTSAQHYTTKQFQAEFNVGGKSISAVVRDLSTGLKRVGFNLDGENSTFDIVADTFKVTTTTGKVPFFTSNGKLNAYFIDAKSIVTEGIKAQTIDAKGATFQNITVTGESKFGGELDGASGTFKVLRCLNSNREPTGGIYFEERGSQAIMAIEGDLGMRKNVEGKFRKRLPRFYAKDVWCQGQFGHYAKICAVVKDDMMYVHHGGHIETNGVKVQLPTVTVKSGGSYIVCYKIPLYAPGYHGADGDNGVVRDVDNPALHPGLTDFEREIPYGAPIDMVIFNCEQPHSYVFFEMGYGKEWVVFNGKDNVEVYICDHREIRKLDGGWVSHYLYVNPLWLTPSKSKETPGAGIIYTGTVDFDW